MRLDVLIGCESSGVVREAFRALGHNAWSNDLLPADDASPYHIQGDVRDQLHKGWDIGIFHPTCTYMALSGAKHFYIDWDVRKGRYEPRWRALEEGVEFFLECLNAPIPAVCVENPKMMGYARDLIIAGGGTFTRQSVQPYHHGHLEQKETLLHLKGLEPIEPTDNVYDAMMLLPEKERAKVHHAYPGKNRWKIRSKSFPGIWNAAAQQWAGLA